MRRIWSFILALSLVCFMALSAMADESMGKGMFKGQWAWVGNVVGVVILLGFFCFVWKQKKGYWPWQKKG